MYNAQYAYGITDKKANCGYIYKGLLQKPFWYYNGCHTSIVVLLRLREDIRDSDPFAVALSLDNIRIARYRLYYSRQGKRRYKYSKWRKLTNAEKSFILEK